MREFWIAVTLVVTMALAGPLAARTLPYKWLPPVQYDHAYGGKLTIRTATLDQMRRICWGPAYACAFRPTRGSCLVYLPPVDNVNVNAEGLVLLRRHEIGHCNGWAGSHPNGRFSHD